MASETTATPHRGILSEEMRAEREQLIELLTTAYWMEIETVISYTANSINPDGVRAQEIIESLEEDIQEELGHARQFGQRIKELYGVVPGSLDFQAEQSYLQPPEQQTDVVHTVNGEHPWPARRYHRVRFGEVAQSVEHTTENCCVAGSIPAQAIS